VSERAAFVSAILDNLDNDTPRLVFADWLRENGEEPRAEFIRARSKARSARRVLIAAEACGRPRLRF
jgi:uncharacterized protein (TIGR02996 family)